MAPGAQEAEIPPGLVEGVRNFPHEVGDPEEENSPVSEGGAIPREGVAFRPEGEEASLPKEEGGLASVGEERSRGDSKEVGEGRGVEVAACHSCSAGGLAAVGLGAGEWWQRGEGCTRRPAPRRWGA